MFKPLHLLPVILALAPAGAAPKSFFSQTPDEASVVGPSLTPAGVSTPLRVQKSTVVQRSDDGLFYVEARINGAPVQFIVDSGSNVVVLSAADAARTGVGSTDTVEGETAGGAATMRRARIGRVSVAGQTLSDVDAAIVGHDLKVSLLGQSVLSHLNAVTFKGDRLELE